jgi:hypothetical protein
VYVDNLTGQLLTKEVVDKRLGIKATTTTGKSTTSGAQANFDNGRTKLGKKEIIKGNLNGDDLTKDEIENLKISTGKLIDSTKSKIDKTIKTLKALINKGGFIRKFDVAGVQHEQFIKLNEDQLAKYKEQLENELLDKELFDDNLNELEKNLKDKNDKLELFDKVGTGSDTERKTLVDEILKAIQAIDEDAKNKRDEDKEKERIKIRAGREKDKITIAKKNEDDIIKDDIIKDDIIKDDLTIAKEVATTTRAINNISVPELKSLPEIKSLLSNIDRVVNRIADKITSNFKVVQPNIAPENRNVGETMKVELKLNTKVASGYFDNNASTRELMNEIRLAGGFS